MFLCALLFIAGAWCLGNTAAMNFASGAQLADSDLGKIVQPSTTLVIDAMAAILAVVVCTLFANGTLRSIAGGILLGVVLLGFLAFSVKNVVSFGARERLEKALRAEANSSATTTAIKKQNDNALGLQERNLSWLRAEYRTAKSREDKTRLLGEIRAATKAPLEVKAAKVDTVLGDPEADVIAQFFGWKREVYLFWNQLALAILLVLGKTLGFGLAAAMWPRRAGPSAAMIMPEAECDIDGEGEAPELEDAPAAPLVTHVPVAPVRDDQPIADLAALEAPERKAPKRQADEGAEDLDRARRLRAVRRFLATRMERTASTRQGVTADAAFQQYLSWVHENEPQAGMTPMAFGLLCSDLNVAKGRHSGRIRYGLRPVAELPAAVAA
jgi:hypothetical protein